MVRPRRLKEGFTTQARRRGRWRWRLKGRSPIASSCSRPGSGPPPSNSGSATSSGWSGSPAPSSEAPAPRGRRGGCGPQCLRELLSAGRTRPVPSAQRPRRPLATTGCRHRAQGDRPGAPRGSADTRLRPGARPLGAGGTGPRRGPRSRAHTRAGGPDGRGMPAALWPLGR